MDKQTGEETNQTNRKFATRIFHMKNATSVSNIRTYVRTYLKKTRCPIIRFSKHYHIQEFDVSNTNKQRNECADRTKQRNRWTDRRVRKQTRNKQTIRFANISPEECTLDFQFSYLTKTHCPNIRTHARIYVFPNIFQEFVAPNKNKKKSKCADRTKHGNKWTNKQVSKQTKQTENSPREYFT